MNNQIGHIRWDWIIIRNVYVPSPERPGYAIFHIPYKTHETTGLTRLDERLLKAIRIQLLKKGVLTYANQDSLRYMAGYIPEDFDPNDLLENRRKIEYDWMEYTINNLNFDQMRQISRWLEAENLKVRRYEYEKPNYRQITLA